MAFEDPITLETTLPGHTRRWVWLYPEIRSHAAVVLTAEQLWVAPRADTTYTEFLTALETDGKLDELFGPNAVKIELVAISYARLDMLTNSLSIEYAGSGMATKSITLVFPNPVTADNCFTKLWRRLGEGYEIQPCRGELWSLVRLPLTVLMRVIVITTLLTVALRLLENIAAAKPIPMLESILRWADWRMVCVVGGVLSLLVLAWLGRRLTRPPMSLKVMRH